MDTEISKYPQRLQEIIEEFQEVDRQDRMEYLIDYAMDLPDLPARFQEQRDQMEQVHECQSPVFLVTEVNEGKVEFFFDIPMEAPTVRGYAAILVEGMAGLTPDEVLSTPENAYQPLRLREIVSPQRLNGLHFLMRYMKKQVLNLTAN